MVCLLAHPGSDKMPDLSCEGCNERKVRCDKQNPCSTCQATGMVCVPIQRKRLPRGRHARARENKENKELRERLARLESLVTTDPSSSSSSSSSLPSSSSKSTCISISPATTATTTTTTTTSSSPSGISGISGISISYPPPVPVPSGVTSAAASISQSQSPYHSFLLSNTPLLTSPSASSAPPTSLPRTKGPDSPPPRYVANAFWNDLVDKNPGLHGVLSDHPFDRHHPNDNTNNNYDASDRSKLISQQYSHHLQQRAPAGVLGLGFSSHSQNPQSYIDAALALRPTPTVCKKLCQAYLHRVDPIVRVFHRPSLMDFLLDGKSYLDYHDSDPVLDVLRSAVFVVAVVSLTEEQCHSMFDADRTSLIATYRLACEVALDRAGLITTEDITVLQSFVLYLNAVRSHDRSRTAWTLFPIAVRLAIALGLNIDSSHSNESFFEQQMRRRLWYTICLLDVHTSFDRGSEPVIGQKSMHPRLPLNINDAEFRLNSEDCFSDREGLTDMTKVLVLFHAQATGKALGVQEDDTPSSAHAMSKTISPRQQIVEQFEHRTQNLLRYCDPNSSPYAWSTFNGSLAALATMQLSLRRPMSHNGRRGVAVDTDSTNILRLATTVLERDIIMRSDSRGEAFRWFGMVHWHPLAVAIAQCYVCDNVAILRHVWPTIETSFEYIGKVIPEYRQGMLWKPLERLMIKTRSRIHALLEQSNSATYSGMSNSPAYANSSTTLDPSAYGSTTTPLPSSSNSTDLPVAAMPAPFNLTATSSTRLQIAETSTQNNRGSRTIDSQAEASWQQMTPSTPLQTAAMSAENNQGAPIMDSQADASFWEQMTPSMSDAGWDAWDEFIKNFDVNWNDDMVVV